MRAPSRRRTTVVNMVFNYTQLALSLVTGLVLVPVYLKYIPVGLYGAWLAAGSVAIWLSVFDPGVANILMQRVGAAFGNKDHARVNELINGGLMVAAAIGLLMLLGGLAVSGLIISWLKISLEAELVRQAFLIGVLSSSILVMGYAAVAINYGLQSSLGTGLINLLAALTKIAVILALLWSGGGLLSLPYGELASATAIAVLNLVLVARNVKRKKIGYSPRIRHLGELGGLFLYTFTARFSKIVTRSLDNFMISRLLGQESVAVYSLTSRAPRVGENLVGHPVGAFRPAVAHLAGAGDMAKAREVLGRLMRFMLWSLGLLFAGFAAFNDDFVRLWVGGHLFGGAAVSLFICLMLVVHAWTNGLGMLCFSLGNIKGNSLSDLASSILMIPFMYVGAVNFGLAGIVGGQILALLLTTGWYLPLSFARIVGLDRAAVASLARELAVTSAVSLAAVVAFRRAVPEGWPAFALLCALLVLAYAAGLMVLSPGFRSEGAEVMGRLGRRGDLSGAAER